MPSYFQIDMAGELLETSRTALTLLSPGVPVEATQGSDESWALSSAAVGRLELDLGKSSVNGGVLQSFFFVIYTMAFYLGGVCEKK
jgi:hypothetical protein